jgi:hypothetical protein
MFMQQQAGYEIAADDKEDEYAGATLEDAAPNPWKWMGVLDALDAVKRENEKDGESAQTVETGNAAHGGCAREDGFCGHNLVGLLWAIIALQEVRDVHISSLTHGQRCIEKGI